MRRWSAIALAIALSGCLARPRQDPTADGKTSEPGPDDKRLVELDFESGAPEAGRSSLFQLPASRTYTGLVRALERAERDPLTAGVFFRFGTQGVDFARAEELGLLLERFRVRKKLPVVCHSHALTNATSWLVLRGCSRIWLSAAGSVDTVGIAGQLVHLKGLLDRLKIGVDFLSIGKYKGGAEPLTRDEPSEATREALGSTLSSMRTAWLDGVESGRPGQNLKLKLEQGPYSPEEAKARGIVDAIGYETEARSEAKRLAKTQHVTHGFGSGASKGSGLGIGELIRIVTGGDDENRGKPRIAVVLAEGAIGMEAGGPLDVGGIAAKSMTRTLRRLRDDASVKAVVLRIDSPGGSPLASDLIWRELMELRKKKAVVASVGSMAASGGYYIAAGADRIFSSQTSIVGSIGVFGGKIVIGPALHELGVNAFTIPANPDPAAGARALYLSPFTPWDEPTRERVQAHMQSIYDLFVARVAHSRKLPESQIREHAEGRIFSGTQGKERGLVDEIGGLSSAVAWVRKRAGLETDVPVSLEGAREGLLDLLLLDEEANDSQVRAALLRFERDRTLLLALPAELRASIGTLGPLLAGETAIAALPLALELR